jgi:hypothetical protein
VLCLLGGGSREAAAQYTQEGPKLVGSGAIDGCCGSEQGWSVALSADGNTALVGGYLDNTEVGAAWVYTQSGGTWTQQAELVPSDEVGGVAEFGWSVALSADGNTAIMGGPGDNNGVGAMWVWTRSGTTWTEQAKLSGSGYSGSSGQGWSVALSADGNTAIVGGFNDNNDFGAAWVFSQIGGTWSQVGSKLVGSGSSGKPGQGLSVALSADGNTALVGGPNDNSFVGAAWVFTQSGGAWSQVGSKLVGSGYSGQPEQGNSVALSADGNTLAVGGPTDNGDVGAAWVFTLSGGAWSQVGSKLVGSGASGGARQGQSVALSAGGNNAIVGGNGDNNGVGAVWVFSQIGGTWNQAGSKLVGSGYSGQSYQGWSVALSADASTAIVGGYGDTAFVGVGDITFGVGAAWVFVGPGVTAISPTSGPAAGGTSVTITGANFTGAMAVAFGSTPALFEVNSASSISAIAPAGSGTVDVTVTTVVGTSATIAADQFTYIPTLTLSSTASSATQVGQAYSQTNTASGGTTPYTYAVSVGELPAGTTLDPSGGTVSGTPTASGAFSYAITATDSGSPAQTATQTVSGTISAATPEVSSVSPNSGPALGGTIVTVTGTHFTGATAVNFGSNAAIWFNVTSDTSILAKSPAGSGTVDITVTAQGGTSATSGADQFTYQSAPTAPTVSAVSPNGGPPAGGISVAIIGANLTGTSAVKFGANAAAQFAVNSGTSITAIAPAGAVGTVDVTVTTANGTSALSAADHFAYASPRMTQQGPKLVGSGAKGNAEQGSSVALSADGNTAIIGGSEDNSGAGAAWIFDRGAALAAAGGSGNATASSVVGPAAWNQVGSKLVGSGTSGATQQGYAVALSADGNTAIVGGYNDNAGIGAVWIFTRRGGILPLAAAANPGSGPALPVNPGLWSQQGAKLLAGDEAGAGMFGISVALSADGNTAIVGGSADSSGAGAAWIFTRSNGVWTEQAKLVGANAVGNAFQGISVALSSDGNTALIGGYCDNADNGAAWVFVNSGGVWSQQGSKLLGSGNVGAAEQGYSVALSADGNTALVGGFADNADTGAGWIFSRSGGAWTQQGGKLLGAGAIGLARQGFSVALSADASTAAMAGYEDNTFNGAVWVFTQSAGTWTQSGSKLFGTGAVGAAEQGSALALSANGTTLLEGGAFDHAGAGAAWVFVSNGGGVLTATPTAGQGPLAVTFSASGLTPPMTYTVNFGDGTTGALNQGGCIATAAGGESNRQCSASASHVYSAAGTDTATLLNASGITLGSATVTVNASTPMVGK